MLPMQLEGNAVSYAEATLSASQITMMMQPCSSYDSSSNEEGEDDSSY